MKLHVETAYTRQQAAAQANAWMEQNLKPGQFFSMVLTPLLQVTVDVEKKGLITKTLTKRLVYDYSVIINYFSADELIPIPIPLEDTGTAVNNSPLRSYEQ